METTTKKQANLTDSIINSVVKQAKKLGYKIQQNRNSNFKTIVVVDNDKEKVLSAVKLPNKWFCLIDINFNQQLNLKSVN